MEQRLINLHNVTDITPIFGERGYWVSIADGGPFHGSLVSVVTRARNVSVIYLSQDALHCIGAWLALQLERQEKEEQHMEEGFNIGNLTVQIWHPEYVCIKDNIPLLKAAMEKLKAFMYKVDRTKWELVAGSWGDTYIHPSFNYPQRRLQINLGNKTADYGLVLDGEYQYPAYSYDIKRIRIAERLLNVANTVTYPDDGYDLSLKIAFGELSLESLSKIEIRELAMRLLP